MTKRLTVLLLFFFTFCSAFAQDARFLLQFADKAGSHYSISKPEEFLSSAAIERRNRLGISVDETDLPVSKKYIEEVQDAGFSLIGQTKWLNGVEVIADKDQQEALLAIDGVDAVTYLGPVDDHEHVQPIEREAGYGTDQNLTNVQNNNFLKVDSLRNEGWNAEGIKIAIFDAGFIHMKDAGGAGFQAIAQGRLIGQKNFIEPDKDVFRYHAHGTHVFSVMGYYEQGKFEGIAPDADYLLCVTEDVRNEYRYEELNWMMAAEYADSAGVDMIQSSLGYYDFDDPEMNYTWDDLDGASAMITQAANFAASRGILVVNSAGNEGRKSWQKVSMPADSKEVLAVGAVTSTWGRASFSSFGTKDPDEIKPDVVTLGSGVVVASWQDRFGTNSGTSFASPMVAGVAAMVLKEHPDWRPERVIAYFHEISHRCESPTVELGYGVPFNECKPLSNEKPLTALFKIAPNPIEGNRIQLLVGASPVTDCQFLIYDSKGSQVVSTNAQLEAYSLVSLPINTYLNPGVYSLVWKCARGQGSQKLVVK
ncbi:S8 family serine peptidase [Persicobacter psychrovividus]|uniref:Serine protease n=1 Tax=Persicobacter psychrovividus TaxID=387638 RepID=A0ABN6L7G3_9BACT|nr:serine protease [Persicobacter psychrovividus]